MKQPITLSHGPAWGLRTLYNGWGSDVDDETAHEFALAVVELFHTVTTKLGRPDILWSPQALSVQAFNDNVNLDLHGIRSACKSAINKRGIDADLSYLPPLTTFVLKPEGKRG